MKFRYYITDTVDGIIKGTNDIKVVENFAYSSEHFIVDTEAGKWLFADTETDIQDINHDQ